MKDPVLQKYIASSGYCSRRDAQALIEKGRVRINDRFGKLGDRVTSGDKVFVGDVEIIPLNEELTYIMLNKPIDYVCTARKFHNERNIFEIVETDKRLFVAGRLDKNSRGLVLLTNDGDLVYKLTHASFEHEKEYIVTTTAFIDARDAEVLKRKFINGVDIGDGDGVVKAKKFDRIERNEFRVILITGRKRQIRRMFRACGYDVEDLIRVRIGSLELDNLPEGKYRSLREQEIEELKNVK